MTPDTAGAGSTLAVNFNGPSLGAPSGVPQTLVLELQHGFKLNASAVADPCTAAQALQHACPAASQVGTGSATVLLSALPLPPMTINATITAYFGQPLQRGDVGSIIAVLVGGGQTVQVAGRLMQLSSGPYGVELAFDSLPTFTPPPGFTATVQQLAITSGAFRTIIEHRRVRVRVSKHRTRLRTKRVPVHVSLLTNPPKCGGSWAGRLAAQYSSGLFTADASLACAA